MKKWILAVLILLIITIGAIYLIIPGQIRIVQTKRIAVNAKAFFRTVPDKKKWAHWWPGEVLIQSIHGTGAFRYRNTTYIINEEKLSSFVISVHTPTDSFLTELFFLPINPDSVSLSWEGVTVPAFQPVKRIQTYSAARKLSDDWKVILERLQTFYTNSANIYGITIKNELVHDSTLLTTSFESSTYPGTERIYEQIKRLKVFAEKSGARQSGLPMLNVYTTDSISFHTQVALPLDKKIKDEGDIVYRWMLGGGNILATEVKGGPYTINRVFREMENYVSDFERIAPAKPFQSLVTNRSKEPDTSKWITKLYWPVM